ADAPEVDLRAGRAARVEEIGRVRFEDDRVSRGDDGEPEERTELARRLEHPEVRPTARGVAVRELMDLVERAIRPEDLRDAGLVPIPEQVGARSEGHALAGLVERRIVASPGAVRDLRELARSHVVDEDLRDAARATEQRCRRFERDVAASVVE